MPRTQRTISPHHELPFLKDTVHLKNGALGRPSTHGLSTHTRRLSHGLEAPRSVPASSLPPVPDLTPDLLWLLVLICSHLTPCALKWMGQEILQTQTSNSVSFPTSTFAVLHLSRLKAWQDTWQRKSTLRRAPAEGLPRDTQVNRKAVSAVKIDASFSSMGRKHILGTPASSASPEDTLIDRTMRRAKKAGC